MNQHKSTTRTYCPHTDTIHEKNGDIICRNCGMVLDNVPLFKGTGTFQKKATYTHEIDNLRPTIGSHKERRSRKFRRLSDRNKQMDTLYNFRMCLFHELRRLLGVLHLPDSFIDDLVTRGMKFYRLFKWGSPLRNKSIIAAASLYFTSLERAIFIRFNELSHLITGQRCVFREAIRSLYLKIPEFKKFNHPAYRKKLILQQIHGLHEKIKQRNEHFIRDAREWIDRNWHDIKNQRNRIIAALAYIKVRKRLPQKLAADFLGVKACNISLATNKVKDEEVPESARKEWELEHFRTEVRHLEDSIRILKGTNLYLSQRLAEQKRKTRELVEKYCPEKNRANSQN